MRTARALIVMPFSRSRSIESRSWATISRCVDGAGVLEQPIGEGRFAVVDVGDDAEVADALEWNGAHFGPSADERRSESKLS